MSLNINLRVKSQYIEVASICPIVSGTLEEYTINFEFDSSWDNYAKTAVIDVICGDPIPDQLILEGSCSFSIGKAKKIRFGVYGVQGSKRLPTVYTREITVKEGAQPSEGSQVINPTQYEQLLAILLGLEEASQEEIDKAVEKYMEENPLNAKSIIEALGYTPGQRIVSVPSYNVEVDNDGNHIVRLPYDSPEPSQGFVFTYIAPSTPINRIILKAYDGKSFADKSITYVSNLEYAEVSPGDVLFVTMDHVSLEAEFQEEVWSADLIAGTTKPTSIIGYYESFNDAISDANEGTFNKSYGYRTRKTTVQMVKDRNGKTTITLLSNTTERKESLITKDIDIVLNGHVLVLDSPLAKLSFAEGTSCTINGEVEGSCISTSWYGNLSQFERIDVIETRGKRLSVVGGEYELYVNTDLKSGVFMAYEPCELLEMRNCSVTVVNALDTYTSGVTKASRCVLSKAAKSLFEGVKMQAQSISGVDGLQNASPLCVVKNCTIHTLLNPNCGMDLQDPNNALSKLRSHGDDPKTTGTLEYDGTGTCTYGIYNSTGANKLYVEGTIIHADAPGCDAYTESSVGIYTRNADTFVANSELYATHSGIDSQGNLYVRNSILSGTSHGGIYIGTYTYKTAPQLGFEGTEEEWIEHLKDKKVYLKDTSLRGGYYKGVYNEAVVIQHGGYAGNSYIGNYYNTIYVGSDVYVDGCTFETNGGKASFVVRQAKYAPNRMFISNSKILPEGGSFRVMNTSPTQDMFDGELYIGVGCNFTADQLNKGDGSPDNVTKTDSLYRKFYAGEGLTAEDFQAIADSGTKGQFVRTDGDGNLAFVSLTNVGEVGM